MKNKNLFFLKTFLNTDWSAPWEAHVFMAVRAFKNIFFVIKIFLSRVAIFPAHSNSVSSLSTLCIYQHRCHLNSFYSFMNPVRSKLCPLHQLPPFSCIMDATKHALNSRSCRKSNHSETSIGFSRERSYIKRATFREFKQLFFVKKITNQDFSAGLWRNLYFHMI